MRVRSSRAELFVSGPEIRRKMLQLIGGARHSILINSYLVTKSAFTTQIIEALKLKQAQGVRVQVITDSSSRFVAAPAAFDELTKAGIPWAEFHPIHLATVGNLPRLLERDHRKVWIIDGRTVFLGGANLTSESLGDPGANGNLDLMVAFDSPEDLLGKLKPHEDGVVLTIGQHGATFLPQVWEQLPDKAAFLDHLSQKAGCDPSAWRGKDTSVAIYRVEAFQEPD